MLDYRRLPHEIAEVRLDASKLILCRATLQNKHIAQVILWRIRRSDNNVFALPFHDPGLGVQQQVGRDSEVRQHKVHLDF